MKRYITPKALMLQFSLEAIIARSKGEESQVLHWVYEDDKMENTIFDGAEPLPGFATDAL